MHNRPTGSGSCRAPRPPHTGPSRLADIEVASLVDPNCRSLHDQPEQRLISELGVTLYDHISKRVQWWPPRVQLHPGGPPWEEIMVDEDSYWAGGDPGYQSRTSDRAANG